MQTRKKYYIAFIKYFSNARANLKYIIVLDRRVLLVVNYHGLRIETA